MCLAGADVASYIFVTEFAEFSKKMIQNLNNLPISMNRMLHGLL